MVRLDARRGGREGQPDGPGLVAPAARQPPRRATITAAGWPGPVVAADPAQKSMLCDQLFSRRRLAHAFSCVSATYKFLLERRTCAWVTVP